MTSRHDRLLTVAAIALCGAVPARAWAAPPSSTPLALARRAGQVTGNPYAAQEIRFAFVATVGGAEKARRSYVYRPGEGKVSVTSEGKTVTLVRLARSDPSRAARAPEKHAATWRLHAPGVAPRRAAKAWHAFVNDSFWLWAPAKLSDRGVTLSSPTPGQLEVTYGNVGVTPGDRYRLYLDGTGRVSRWSYVLGNGRKGDWRWLDYKRFGSLLLSLRRVSKDGKAVIRFEAISVR